MFRQIQTELFRRECFRLVKIHEAKINQQTPGQKSLPAKLLKTLSELPC